jgi:hypothetical protein
MASYCLRYLGRISKETEFTEFTERAAATTMAELLHLQVPLFLFFTRSEARFEIPSIRYPLMVDRLWTRTTLALATDHPINACPTFARRADTLVSTLFSPHPSAKLRPAALCLCNHCSILRPALPRAQPVTLSSAFHFAPASPWFVRIGDAY